MASETASPAKRSGRPPRRQPGGTDSTDRPGTAATVAVIGGGHRGRRIARLLAPVATVRQFETRAITSPAPDDRAAGALPAGASDTPLSETLSGDVVSIVASADDARNLLVTQRLRTSFDVARIYVVVNDPRNRVAFALPGVSTLCLAELLAAAFVRADGDTREPPAEGVSPGP